MSREIKFRCWQDKKERYYYYDRNNLEIYMDQWREDSLNGRPLEQYTGLKDKHGKEIYENDRLHCVIGKEWLRSDVAWSQGTLSWVLKGEACYGVKLSEMRECNIEIIGNIHEEEES